MNKHVSYTKAEWVIMDAVWTASPATVRDVHERVAKRTGWAYSTVKTMLERLVEKGALRAEKRGNVGVFSPLVTRGRARGGALRALLDKAFGGAFGSLVQHLVTEERLSKRDRRELAEILNRLRDEDGNP